MLLLGLLKVVTSRATQPSRHKVFSSLTCLVLGDENLPDFNSHNDYPLQALTGSINNTPCRDRDLSHSSVYPDCLRIYEDSILYETCDSAFPPNFIAQDHTECGRWESLTLQSAAVGSSQDVAQVPPTLLLIWWLRAEVFTSVADKSDAEQSVKTTASLRMRKY